MPTDLDYKRAVSILRRYEQRTRMSNANGSKMVDRCKLCDRVPANTNPRTWRESCPCRDNRQFLARENARPVQPVPNTPKKKAADIFAAPTNTGPEPMRFGDD